MAACSAQIGSASVTITLTPFCRKDAALPFPTSIFFNAKTPVVVSSETPLIFFNMSLYSLCIKAVRSPPSSKIIFGFQSFFPSIVCFTHHQYSSSVSPFQAKTGIPVLAIAAAAWSCVENILHEDHLASAPRSTSVSIKTAV